MRQVLTVLWESRARKMVPGVPMAPVCLLEGQSGGWWAWLRAGRAPEVQLAQG